MSKFLILPLFVIFSVYEIKYLLTWVHVDIYSFHVFRLHKDGIILEKYIFSLDINDIMQTWNFLALQHGEFSTFSGVCYWWKFGLPNEICWRLNFNIQLIQIAISELNYCHKLIDLLNGALLVDYFLCRLWLWYGFVCPTDTSFSLHMFNKWNPNILRILRYYYS